MSGIAGIIHFDGAPVAAGLIEGMTSAMAYRGPDGIHHWQRGSVALGQCMLRTTPESLEETQPLANEDESLILVMDGRVDNWEELRRELLSHGALLRDRSDAELVLRAFETWGRDCLDRIDGDFALAIWDARQQQLFCARDRIGNKSFYYQWNGTTLVFASELHPILALPWVPEVPNDGMLAEFLAAEWHSRDETLWNGILRLVAAHRMVVGTAGPRTENYWEPDLWATLPYRTDQDYIEHYLALFSDCVRRASRSHRQLACEVSGGLDSSAVFCMADHLRRDARLPAPSVAGYTLAFADDGNADELGYARAMGEHIGLRIHEIPPSIMPLSWFAESANAYREFPGFPNAAMFVDIRRRAAMQGSRVVLTGEGGDEWLEGSRAYYAEELAQRHWRILRECFSNDAATFGTAQAMRWFVRHGVVPLLPVALQGALRRTAHVLRGTGPADRYWLSAVMRAHLVGRRRQSRASRHPGVRSVGQQHMLAALHDAHSDHVMGDSERIGARTGVELRFPLRDHRLVQFAFSTPERLRLRGDRTKYIHVQALRGIVPQSILDRTSKAEFSDVFRAQLDRMETTLTRTIPERHRDWVTQDGMEGLYRLYRDHPQHGWPLWALWSIHACASMDALFRGHSAGYDAHFAQSMPD